MRIFAAFAVVVAMAGAGCSHHKSAPPAPTAHFSSVPGMDTPAAAPAAGTPSAAGPQVIPFGAAAAAPATEPTENSPAASVTAAPAGNSGPAPGSAAPLEPSGTKQKLIVTPEQGSVGKIATVNEVARFVIVTFPVGHVPPVDQTLYVYRNGLKVGELKVTEPQRDEFTAADIVNGETGVGDEVRDK